MSIIINPGSGDDGGGGPDDGLLIGSIASDFAIDLRVSAGDHPRDAATAGEPHNP